MGLFGRKLGAAEREAALNYYEAAVRVTAFQEREGDLYNSALMSHMNSLDEPASAASMVAASARLRESSRELRRRHVGLNPLPDIDLVAQDYASWALLYLKYEAWAHAQADAFVAIAAQREPAAARVAALMADAEAARRDAEKASQRLMSAVGLSAGDLRRVHQAAYEESEQSDWEPTPDANDETGDEDMGLLGRDAPLELVHGIAVPALELLPMSTITNGEVEAFDPTLPYGLLKVLILPGQTDRSGTATLAITHRDDYRALHWAMQETHLPDGVGVWVVYSPDPQRPELASVGIVLMDEEGDEAETKILKAPQQRLDI